MGLYSTIRLPVGYFWFKVFIPFSCYQRRINIPRYVEDQHRLRLSNPDDARVELIYKISEEGMNYIKH